AASPRVADPFLPEEAFRLTVGDGGDCRVAFSPGVHARLADKPVDKARAKGAEWPDGAQLAVGASLFGLVKVVRPDAALQPSEDGGGWDYTRPPRVRPARRQTTLNLPQPPTDNDSRAFPIIMVLSPLLIAGGSVVMTRQLGYLLIALLSPLAWVVQHLI